MPVHLEILAAVQRICHRRPDAAFAPDEVVRMLPHLNAQTVRTHITSRCCVNARPHHQSRLDYFRRIGRARYELLPKYRLAPRRARRRAPLPTGSVARDTIHAILTKSGSWFTVECHEIALVTQGKTIDEALANLQEAVGLHLEGEDLAALGLQRLKRIHVSYDLPANVTAA